jgi:Calponin homology (CH) domain
MLKYLCWRPTGAAGLVERAIIPCDRRVHRLANVEAAFAAFDQEGVELSAIRPQHIVDGDRSKTLVLLWSLILQLQVP